MSTHCGRTRRLLWPDAGPRAASAEVIEAKEHLSACASCQRFLADMRAVAEVAAAAPAATVPAAFRERLFDALARRRTAVPTPARWRRRSSAPIVAAASIILLGVAVAGLLRQRSTPISSPDVLSALADDHAHTLADTHIASTDQATVARWFSSRVPFAVTVPVLPGMAIREARVVMVDGRASAVVEYAVHSEVMSYFIIPTRDDRSRDAGPLRFVHASRNGYQVVSWHEPGLLHAMVGNVSPSQLERLARHCVDQMNALASRHDVGEPPRG